MMRFFIFLVVVSFLSCEKEPANFNDFDKVTGMYHVIILLDNAENIDPEDRSLESIATVRFTDNHSKMIMAFSDTADYKIEATDIYAGQNFFKFNILTFEVNGEIISGKSHGSYGGYHGSCLPSDERMQFRVIDSSNREYIYFLTRD